MHRRPVPGLRQRLARGLMQSWWPDRPNTSAGALTRLLRPLSLLYGSVARRRRQHARPQRAPVPVLVVGNLVVGGAGKTPTVIALVDAFKAAGHRPGVVSRGFGRVPTHDETAAAVRAVAADDDPDHVGDEPLLIVRRTGVPVWVGRDRVAAARALCAAEPDVDLLICDDGLQHHALARDAELIVFDNRGAGNGLLLPAGPLREPLPAQLAAHQRVLYTGSTASTPLPGPCALRRAGHAQSLTDWRALPTGAGPSPNPPTPLSALRGRGLLAVAGMAHPAKFFDMLAAAGLQIECLPLPDHYGYAQLPWSSATTDVITTEKDAVKLDPARLPGLRAAAPRVWVVPLDLQLPATLVDQLTALLFPR